MDKSAVRSIRCVVHLSSIWACPSGEVVVLDIEALVEVVANIVESSSSKAVEVKRDELEPPGVAVWGALMEVARTPSV